MWFTSHMSHICRLSSLKRERKPCKRVPVRMQSDIRGVSPTSGGACHPSHLRVLLLFPRSPAVREELVSAPIKGKMPILHRVSEQPQSINQPGGERNRYYVCVCVSVCMCVHVCICPCAAEARSHPGVLFSHLWKGPLIRKDAVIKASCGFCLKKEGACNVFDTKGCERVCCGHKAHADCLTTAIIGAETRQWTPTCFLHYVVFNIVCNVSNRKQSHQKKIKIHLKRNILQQSFRAAFS